MFTRRITSVDELLVRRIANTKLPEFFLVDKVENEKGDPNTLISGVK
jgi:hypothetical protein